MGHKSFKPYTPGRRQMTVSSFDEITTNRPEKSLLAPIHNHGGRNNSGKTTVRTELLILREIKIIFRQQLQP